MEKIKLTAKDLAVMFPFRKCEVEKLNNPVHYAKVGNTSAYVQLRTSFDKQNLEKLLSKLDIKHKVQGKVLLFGGYTGQYAKSLRDLGYNVIFTDLLPEWVEEARKKGFEAYQAKAEDIPLNLQDEIDFYTTFECYGPLVGCNALKIILESAGNTEQGLVFIENEQGLNNPEYNHNALLVAALNKIKNIYPIKISEEESPPLHAIRIDTGKSNKKLLSGDLMIMRVTNYLIEDGKPQYITPYHISELVKPQKPEFTEQRVKDGIERIIAASE